MSRILFVDDDAATRSQLAQALKESGHDVVVAASGEEAIARLDATDLDLDLVITDLIMGRVDGLEVLDAACRNRSDTPVLILTGQGTIDSAVDAMRRGALDYVTKPVDLDRLELAIEKAMTSRRILRQNAELKRQLANKKAGRRLIGNSPPMVVLAANLERIAETNATVLLLGESGTGKELVAEAIHNLSERADKPLIKVNCAALAEGVLESELFGHERGAYTGALRSRQGRFEAAAGGTIFLDEIGDVSVASQLKLLRVLQERTIERVGATHPVPVDVRVIAATNRNLKQAASEGTFRQELFYRLSVVTLYIPPLRERGSDLSLLINAFIDEFNVTHGRNVEGLTPDAMRAVTCYQWPGNVRELRNCIESLVVMTRKPVISEADLPEHVRGDAAHSDVVIPIGRTLDDVSRQYIMRTLESVGSNKTRAARILGIGTKTLYRKLHEFGLFNEHGGAAE